MPPSTPSSPPMLVSTAASVRNWNRILRFLAPIAFFRPISLVPVSYTHLTVLLWRGADLLPSVFPHSSPFCSVPEPPCIYDIPVNKEVFHENLCVRVFVLRVDCLLINCEIILIAWLAHIAIYHGLWLLDLPILQTTLRPNCINPVSSQLPLFHQQTGIQILSLLIWL